MNYSVLRKFLSTTSVFAVTAALTACSGDMERFGAPGSGYTSNQQEIFTNSARNVPVQTAVNQPMPAAVAAAPRVTYKAPVYTTPASVPVSTPVASAAPVQLVTNTVKPTVQTPVYSQPLPAPVSTPVASAPVYTPVAVKQPARIPVASAPQIDYTSTGSINSAALNKPPVIISSFKSMPKAAPKRKVASPAVASVPVSTQRMPVQVPVSAQAMPQQPAPAAQNRRFSLSNLFSTPRNAPRRQPVDYRSTASIQPPASIPAGNRNTASSSRQDAAALVPAAPIAQPVAPTQQPAVGSVRTSGKWSSAGGSMVTVRPGEDITTLSRRYGVPAKAIADVNGLVDPRYIAPGQRVLIPVYQQSPTQYPAVRQQVATLNPQFTATPSVMRVPKANPLRLQSQTSYGKQVIQIQQAANAQNRHMVMPGDTLSAVASRYGVRSSDLARANGLSPNASLRMGQRLHIPRATRGQPVANGIDYTATASINRTPVGLPGQTVQTAVPGFRLTRVPISKPRQLVRNSNAASVKRTANGVASLPKAKQKVASVREPVGLPQNVKTDAAPASPKQTVSLPAASAPKFRWPVRGRIISSYGRKSDGGRNDGINLAVPAGTSVRVAESGTVIYSGSKLKGYGNLVLVQHENGWVTAYAHNEKVLVTKGQQVRRGQIISQAGKSGNVDSPQLHFELRIKGDPVDPVPYLVSS